MKNYELKMYLDAELPKQNFESIKTLIDSRLEAPLSGVRLKINPKSKAVLKQVEEYLETSLRESISDGCYGSRPGTSSKGWTAWVHPSKLTDRYLDDDGTELVNPWHLLEEHGKQLENLDGEEIEELLESLGIESKSDNTYNFNGHNSEDCTFMFDFQFTTFETDKKFVACIMFHCGGDPRGNYTSKGVWVFDSSDDFYSVIFPYKILTPEEA